MDEPGYIWGQALRGRETWVHRYTARMTSRGEVVTIFCGSMINTQAAGRRDRMPGGPGFLGECPRCKARVARMQAKPLRESV